MADLTCPKCNGEPVKLYVEYECANGHKYGDQVSRAMPSKAVTTEPEGKKMPFGKYKGTPMSEVPVDYFEWCLENMDRLSPDLQQEMENQIALKKGEGVVRGPQPKITGTKVKF